jgi:hypothetical protein
MKIEGPEIYELALTPDKCTPTCVRGRNNFSGIATNDMPKLYIVSIDGKPVYVGQTKRSVGERFRYGMKAVGANGYHGYAWRRGNEKATLRIWCHMDAAGRNERDIETVEAEVVFLIRSAGQWPAFQTEIHFHPSTDVHRRVAADIMAHYEY